MKSSGSIVSGLPSAAVAAVAAVAVVVASAASLVFAPAPALAAGEPHGVLRLEVDAREASRRILHARIDTFVLPGEAGRATLVFPKWIPGEHGPTGPLTDLAGVVLLAGERTLAWQRDPLDLYAFSFEMPDGGSEIEIQLDFLTPAPGTEGFSGAASASARLAVLSWNQVLLYPQGVPAAALTVEPSLRIPEGWQFGTALKVASRTGDLVRFVPVTLDRLIDSPVLMGAYLREFALGAKQPQRHFLVAAADSAAALEMPDAHRQHLSRLVDEAMSLFGSLPYGDYRFLLTLSDQVAHFGLEHHESSDDRVSEGSLVDDDQRLLAAGLLPHEFVHSWNGKFRRPADLATPDFQTPMKSELLWVYEGLTQYLGWVLTARSGLYNSAQALDELAGVAEWARLRGGRRWRSLEDTATSAQLLYYARADWSNLRRGVDFYDEGLLVWLDADVSIRRATAGKKSLDDFCRLFFGGQDGAPAVRPFVYQDVVDALTRVAPLDWAGFFRDRVRSVAAEPPLAGIEGAGWHLEYTAERTALAKVSEDGSGDTDLASSIGLSLNKNGGIVDVVPGGPADLARVAPAARLVAVDGRHFSPKVLRDAIRLAAPGALVELLIENGEYFSTLKVQVPAGERYAHLARSGAEADLLAAILAPKRP